VYSAQIDDATGRELHLTYVESRRFYCHWMELLAVGRPELDRLRTLGVNVQICGYDTYTPDALDAETL
jgi:hypothetical protein